MPPADAGVPVCNVSLPVLKRMPSVQPWVRLVALSP